MGSEMCIRDRFLSVSDDVRASLGGGGGGLGKDGISCCLGIAFEVALAIISSAVIFGTACGAVFGVCVAIISCALGIAFDVAVAIISCADTFGGGAIYGWADGRSLTGVAFCVASAIISCSEITLCFAFGAFASGISSSLARRCGDGNSVGSLCISPSAKRLATAFGGGGT